MPANAPVANALLDNLDPLTAITIGGTVEDLEVGQVVLQCGAPEVDVYFPITAVLSLMSTMASGDSCEVALVGREGMVGLTGVLAAASESPTTCVVQVGGSCLRASAESVRAARMGNMAMRETLDRYTTGRLVQVAQVAACNRLHPIGSRLARWLLTLRDRVDRDHLKLSQQNIADALGVHRPTIAVELQRLDATGAVIYRNRILRIVDRARLEALACECHEALHREYVRLFRPLASGEPAPEATVQGSGDAAIEALRAIAGRLLVSSLQEQAARERAEASDRAKDDFLAMVSHELRTPLQSILGWCALSKLPSPPPKALEAIERSARAQLKLIEDLIDSARMGAHTLRIVPQQINPGAVIESAIEMVRPVAEAKHVELRLNVMDELSPIHADEDRLRQVIVNVLMNSVKFSKADAYVDAEVTAPDGAIQVRVVDHGDGIPREVLPHVFDRFWQAQDTAEDRRHGLGLGLSIARALVELHGGTIVLDSGGEGQGATCTITLPRSLPISQPTAEPTERR